MSEDRAAIIQQATTWLRAQPQRPSPVIPAIRDRFGLTALEAVQAIRGAS